MLREIKEVWASDAGRIAVSADGFYEVVFKGISRVDDEGNVFALVESNKRDGGIFTDFHIIGGRQVMYWKLDEAKDMDYPEMTLDISTAVHASSHVNQPRSLFEIMAYLTSETGECADWLVNPDRQKEDLLGECADVIICALDLALRHKKETSDLDGQELADEVIGQLNDLLKLKAEKWMDKHAKV